MTTNRMGLEQTLSDGELTVITDTDHVQCGDAAAMACELLAYRKASREPVADVIAWSHPTEERTCDIRWRRFDVEPGSLFTVPPLQAVTVPDEMTIRDACKFVQDMRIFDDVSVIVMRTWNACRAAMLKSVTNEP